MITVREAALFFSLLWLLLVVSIVLHSFRITTQRGHDSTMPGVFFEWDGSVEQWGVLTVESSNGERHVLIIPYSGAEGGQPLQARHCFRIAPSPSCSPQIRSNHSVRGQWDSSLISWKRSQLLLFDLNHTLAHTPIHTHTTMHPHPLRECGASYRSLAKVVRFAAQISG